ncbi:class I SAM-dependent methyltransferase [Kitasatospora sp. NA04385]|uniref:SAM-dependent methyltransferase n=1 Tax=Kitasatospora sp. NA04385 TaxID=2742135 RepID=UPI0015924C14|nr:class I SAM-dependent methyltransferase [Kitasatospora sp. NA04385]QKW18827.1 class I SAM-dependent methyltransferase [Kitasatospora sp. NA04385]
MERHEISRIAHRDHPVAAPLSDESVRELLERLLRGRSDGRLLDLGCGEAPWLVRALAAHPALRAVGVDTDPAALRTALHTAQRLGVARRIGLHHRDVREFSTAEPFDAVLCVGATHAFGGLGPALAAIGPLLAPGGAVLLGESYWEREPPARARELLGEGLTGLAGTLAAVEAAGWLPVAGHTSTRAELDAYEWSWTGSLTDWALDQPPGPDREAALHAAAEHRREWLDAYRDCFGFVTLLLRPGSRAGAG